MDLCDYKTTSKCGMFVVIFYFIRILKALSIFLSYDVLKVLPLSLYLLFISATISFFVIILQKPFTSGHKLKLYEWMKVGQYSVASCIIQAIVFSGLSLCGPYRFILIYEHNEVIVLSLLSCIFLMNSRNPSKSRGTFIFICAIFCLLFLDHDHNEDLHSPDKSNTNINNDYLVSFILNKIVIMFGLSDHKVGVILLILGLLLDTSLKYVMSKPLSHSIGGFKKLNALNSLFSTVIWLIICSISYFLNYYDKLLMSNDFYSSYWHIFIVIFFISVIYGVTDFYVTSITNIKYGVQFVAWFGTIVMSITGLVLSFFWNHPYTTSKTVIHKVIISENDISDHNLSVGVIFSQVLITYACYLLASSYNRNKGNKGNFVGYSKSGLPLYTFSQGDDFIHRTGQSIIVHLKRTLIEILSDESSRRIFYYLCVNLGFAFVELFYGFLTNSLALISDGFHMLFDSTAIVLGLYAAIVSRWKPTKIFSFGYHRVEALSGFINGLFLVVISFSVCCNGITRLIHPPEVSTERLMFVSVLGLIVNLFGIMALGHSHGHSHGGEASSNCNGINASHSHSHSHGHGHSHGHSQPHSNEHDSSNMRGVYLHVLADTLGSVGVIFSSFLMDRYGWYIADPLCSLFISILILRSVMPLLSQTLSILTLQQPPQSISSSQFENGSTLIKELLTIDEVKEVRNPCFWQHTSNISCCTVRIFLDNSADEQDILAKVIRCMRYFKFEHITIQMEKESFEMHMLGLGNRITKPVTFDRSMFNTKIVIK